MLQAASETEKNKLNFIQPALRSRKTAQALDIRPSASHESLCERSERESNPPLARRHLLAATNIRIEFLSFKHAPEEFQTDAFPLDVRSQTILRINGHPC